MTYVFCRSRRPVPVRRAVGAAPEPLSVDDSSDSGSSSDDDSSAISFMEKSSSTSTFCVSFQVCNISFVRRLSLYLIYSLLREHHTLLRELGDFFFSVSRDSIGKSYIFCLLTTL